MLVLPRKTNECITISDDIVVTVLEVRGDEVLLGVVCPKELPVHEPWSRVVVVPDWLAWQDGTVLRLATTIAEKGDYAALPILADALEDAGCADAVILEHCRSCGPDVRRSWVVDFLTSPLP